MLFLAAADISVQHGERSDLVPELTVKTGYKVVIHKIKVIHPADPYLKLAAYELLQVKNEKGDPVEYSMVVDSVVCAGSKCNVIKVRMFWDALGQFSRYELPPGLNLTKEEHKPFTPADHEKLKSILHDPDSPLRTSPLQPAPFMTNQVDVVASATPKTLQRSVVQGAAYTCYSLWHWAQGDVAGIARELTCKACSKDMLYGFLESDDKGQVLFAMDQIKQRQMHDPETRTAVMKAMQVWDRDRMDAGLAYLRQALPEKDDYYGMLADLFASVGNNGRVYLITLLTLGNEPVPVGFCERLARTFPLMDTYYEVHMLLRFIEIRDAGSPKINTEVAELLKNKNFFIARRALWYLQKQEMSGSLQKEVQGFLDQNRGRLGL